MKKLKKRRAIIALLLSFASPGLGQMYNGQIKKAIILYLTGLVLGLIIGSLSVINFNVMIFCLAIMLCYFLFILFEALYSSLKLKKITLKSYNKWFYYIIIALIFSFLINPLYSSLIKNNIMQAYRIPSSAMEPALMVGDHIITNKFIYKFKNPVRGDIIVFLYPEDPRKVFIKRVIATEGEEIRIKDKQVFINGKAIDDPWGVYGERRGLFIPGPLRPRDNYGPKVVPPNSLFVLGDNRDNSQDSRYWGFVDLSAVKGKALYIYWAKNSSRIGTDIK